MAARSSRDFACCLTSHVEGVLKTRLGFVLLPTALGWVALGFAQEQQFAPLAMQLRFVVPLPRLLHQGQRFFQGGQPAFRLAQEARRLRQQGQKMGPLKFRPGRPVRVETLPYLHQALGTVLLDGYGPATHDEPQGPHEGKSLGGGHGDRRVGLVADGRRIAAQLTQEGVVIQRARQRIGMGELLGQAQGLALCARACAGYPRSHRAQA